MKLFLLYLFTFLFLITLVTADGEVQTLGTFAKGSDINLIQICSNCSFNNISSVLYPNGSIAVSNVAMTKSGTSYNYTLSSNLTNTLGRFIVNGFGDLNGRPTVWSYDFFITPTGKKAAEGESRVLVFLDITIFIVAIILFIFGLFLPQNIFKLAFYGLSSIFLIAGIMFSTALAQNYIETNESLTLGYERFLFLLMIIGASILILALVFAGIGVIKYLKNAARFSE